MMRTMKRMFGVGTILVSAVAAASAMSSIPGTAETGSMVLIGVGLVLTASIARQKLRSRG